jgi:butyrate kinase
VKAVLALESGYLESRVGVSDGETASVQAVAPGDDPFRVGEVLARGVPALVAVPAGPDPQIYPWHPRNLAAVKAQAYCALRGIPCLVVGQGGPAELPSPARLSGRREYRRRGSFYDVPQTDALEQAVSSLGLDPAAASGITVYLGDEVSVSSHRGRSLVDTSNPAACEGPFGLTSAGTIPATAFVSYAASLGAGRIEGATERVKAKLKAGSGAYAYAGVESFAALASALEAGHDGAVRGVRGMSYQVAKEVGRQFGALQGKVDFVAICGPGASLPLLASGIEDRVSKWTTVLTFTEDLTMRRLFMEGIGALSPN